MPDPWSYATTGREHSHQSALFMWANMAEQFGITAADNIESYTVKGAAIILRNRHLDTVPQLEWLHAIHNQGHGDKIRGGIARAEGVKPGVFDVFLPYPTVQPVGLRAGLYVELKKPGKHTVSADQKLFKEYAERVGYVAEFAVGWLEARKIILDYLGLGG